MFDNDERIIVLAQRLRHREGVVVVDSAFARDCTIEGDDFRGLLTVLRHGHLSTAREMRHMLQKNHSMSEQTANDLLEGLFDLHLITTNRRMPLTMEEISMNPSGVPLAPRTPEDMRALNVPCVREDVVGLPQDATPFMRLLAQRSSVRLFSRQELTDVQAASLSRAALGGWGMHRSIPSAGGLYPWRVVTLIRRDGAYHLSHGEIVSTRRVRSMFVPHAPCEAAPIYLVIVADYERATKKYGARGWRYAILEAGHSAQNVEIHALELGLATCEIGAFTEATCIRILKLSETEVPLIIIAGGYASTSSVPIRQSESDRLVAAYVGSTGIINSFEVRKRDPNFFIDRYSVRACIAAPIVHRGKEMDVQTVGAESSTRDLAVVKAIAEGVERFNTGWISQPVKIGTMASLGNTEVIHPRDLQRYGRGQPAPSRLTTFDQHSTASWYKARKWRKDGDAYVAGDFLFYPYGDDGKKLFSYATSNGVAAHTNFESALWNATSELLERESLIAWWFSGAKPHRVPDSITQGFYRQICAWKTRGIEIRLLDITTSIPCACAVGIDRRHRSTFVATSSGMDMERAARHACSEVLRSISGFEGKRNPRVSPHRVRTVEDHLLCYAGGYAFEYADAWSDGTVEHIRADRNPVAPDPETWLEWVVDNVGPLFYHEYALPKSTFRDQPLVVVRSIIPGVVSIKFGYGEQDLGLPRLRKLMRRCRAAGSTTGRSVPKLHPLA